MLFWFLFHGDVNNIEYYDTYSKMIIDKVPKYKAD